tara:strand:- start:13783 stop:14169 length:387 start_codon:yes stop_codon:yes gene_type:complete
MDQENDHSRDLTQNHVEEEDELLRPRDVREYLRAIFLCQVRPREGLPDKCDTELAIKQIATYMQAISKQRILCNIFVPALFFLIFQMISVVQGSNEVTQKGEIIKEYQTFTQLLHALYRNTSFAKPFL